jgi:hypothetical protein
MKDQKEQSNFQVGLAIAGGLLFMMAAAAEILFVVVAIVMLVKGDTPSFGLITTLAIVMLVGWAMVRLGKEKLGNALSQIANSLG